MLILLDCHMLKKVMRIQKNFREILITLLSIFTIFSLGFYFGISYEGPEINRVNTNSTEKDLDLNKYWNVWEKVQLNYVDAEHINKDDAIYGSIKGLVDSLHDPYSSFLTPNETDIFQSTLNSELQGIGAEMTIEDDYLTVVSPLKDSPSEKAGLKPGDIIIAIDQIDSTELSFLEAIEKIRGPRGSRVVLTVVRAEFEEPQDISIIRDRIELESVTSEIKQDNIFYISINQFSDDTEKEFFEAVNEALLLSPKGIILDLRFNGGGYLESAVNIMGEFLEDGLTGVIIESTASRERETLPVSGKQRLANVPLVILINEGSASASEILAGALQDYGKAFLIGKTTYGKGSVQEVEILPDGSSLRLTIAKWLTPNNRDIDHEGIAPDLEVEITEEDIANEYDRQLEEAIEYLNNLAQTS